MIYNIMLILVVNRLKVLMIQKSELSAFNFGLTRMD